MIRPFRLAAAVALALLATRAASADTLVVCTEASPNTLNAMLSTANTAFDVAAQMYDELVETQRGASTIIPAVAEAWEVAPDGLSVTFHLRHGIAFQSVLFASSDAFTAVRKDVVGYKVHVLGGTPFTGVSLQP